MYSVKKKKLVSWSDPNKKPPLERLDITVNYRLGPYGEGILSWRFGPYSKGRYLMILGAMQSRVIAFGLPMPPEGRFHFNLQEPLHFVVRYEKDGRSIASPSLSIDPSRVKDEKGMTVIWHASGKS